MHKIDAILRIELGLDPSTLDDQTWATRFNEWAYAQGVKQKILKASLMEVAAEIFKAFNKNGNS